MAIVLHGQGQARRSTAMVSRIAIKLAPGTTTLRYVRCVTAKPAPSKPIRGSTCLRAR